MNNHAVQLYLQAAKLKVYLVEQIDDLQSNEKQVQKLQVQGRRGKLNNVKGQKFIQGDEVKLAVLGNPSQDVQFDSEVIHEVDVDKRGREVNACGGRDEEQVFYVDVVHSHRCGREQGSMEEVEQIGVVHFHSLRAVDVCMRTCT